MTATLGLAVLELRRFLRGRLTAAALVVLAVVPLLYGALYLYAFWDPYGRLNHVPAALVLEDRPATGSDGTTVHAGQDLADQLIERKVFDWHVVDQTHAVEGLRDGTYHVALRIGPDFSASLTTGPDPAATPRAAQLSVVSDDATNYLSGQFARTAFSEVRSAAASSAATTYFERMLIGFTDLKKQTREAADGAGRLRDGAMTASGGADQLNGGLSTAENGAGQLAGGLGTAATGADRLVSGLGALNQGAGQLADGTAEAAAGGRRLADAVGGAADRVGPVLRENASLIENAANRIATGADALADGLGALPAAADDLVERAVQVRSALDQLPADTPNLGAAVDAADRAVVEARRLRDRIGALDLGRLAADMRAVAANARKVAAAAPHLADDVARARGQVDQLAAGLDRLAVGAGRLRDGTAKAASGAGDLRGGIYHLATGARRLDGGLGQLSAGGRRLADGLGELSGGAARLADGLADGADRIPGYGDDPALRAGVLASPVSLSRSTDHPAATYGVGFAPYFLALALWVGSMVTFMVLRPLNRRHVLSCAPAVRVAFAGYLPAAAVGVTQAAVLFAVVTLGLGLSPVHPLATLGVLMLTSLAFTAIMQLLGAALGPAGRLVALAVLMLQLTSSGGTYPVQTSPGFFQAIHPYLPMTHVVQAMRHTINGGSAGTVVLGVGVLFGFAVAALALTVGISRRARRLTPSALHPELVV